MRLPPAGRQDARSQAGFTLLEILVVLVVVGLLMTGLSKGVLLGVSAVERQSRALGDRAELDAIDRTLRDLITHINPGGGRSQIQIEGKSDRFRFQSRLPGPIAVITRRADMTLLVDDQKRLVLRWRPLLHETALADPPDPTDTVLLDNVEKLDIAYWAPDDGGNEAEGWRDEWTVPYVPFLVRLRLTFPKDDRRHWPEILVAPLLEQPGG
jgi:general secretion pathway protein J